MAMLNFQHHYFSLQKSFENADLVLKKHYHVESSCPLQKFFGN